MDLWGLEGQVQERQHADLNWARCSRDEEKGMELTMWRVRTPKGITEGLGGGLREKGESTVSFLHGWPVSGAHHASHLCRCYWPLDSGTNFTLIFVSLSSKSFSPLFLPLRTVWILATAWFSFIQTLGKNVRTEPRTLARTTNSILDTPSIDSRYWSSRTVKTQKKVPVKK